MQQSESSILQRAVLWDLDGTLIDTRQAHWLAWHETMASEGFDLTWETFAQTFGQRNDTTLRKWLGPNLSKAKLSRLAKQRTSLPPDLPTNRPRCSLGRDLAACCMPRLASGPATMTPLDNMETILTPSKHPAEQLQRYSTQL
jgi:hypothetical protein